MLCDPARTALTIFSGAHRAFVQFDSVDSAIAFTREHFPKLHLDLAQPTDELPDGRFSVYLHYARSRDDADAKTMVGQWPCSSVCEALGSS
jgi:hypothetical protein